MRSPEIGTSPDAIAVASSDEQPKLSQSRGIFQARGRPVERRCSKREPVSNRHAAPSRAVRAVFAPPRRRGFSNHVPPGGVAMPQRGAPQFGASLPHGRRRERPVGPGQFHSERPVGPGRVVPPGRCGFAMVRRSGGATARPLDSIWSLSAAWSPPGEARRTGPISFREANQSGPSGASRAVRICHGAPQRGRNCPATGVDLEPLCRMIAAGRGPSGRASFIQRGESERAVWCLPGGADLPWCAAAGAQLPGHWIRFGASLPHDRRRERPVGPGQFHSERRIRAGRVVPSGRCGFAMVRRSGGATARPLDSIWSLSAA